MLQRALEMRENFISKKRNLMQKMTDNVKWMRLNEYKREFKTGWMLYKRAECDINVLHM
jgi:hypothetical protein